MFNQPRVIYHSLNDERRTNYNKKLLTLTVALTIPIVIFLTGYFAFYKLFCEVKYPEKGIPIFPWIENRAIIYGSLTNEDYSFTVKQPLHKIEKFKLVCYYNLPIDSSPALRPNEIDPYLCTHIIAGFGGVVNNTLSLSEYQRGQLAPLVGLKRINKDLKVLVTVGGAKGDNGFPEMVLNHTNRKQFIGSAIRFLKVNALDGLDLDWEFPGENADGDKRQKLHFTQLLEEIRLVYNKQHKHKFLLSVAVSAAPTMIDDYNLPYMNKFVDFVNLMTYDFHFYTEVTPFTGFNSPLYASANEKYFLSTLNINYTSNYWNYKGMDRDKIIIGLPTYAHTFKLLNPHNSGLYAPCSGYGELGSNGFADYSQVCQFITINQLSPVFDTDAKSPYATVAFEWISFDDEQSLTYKAEFVKHSQFGGAMIYSLNADDYRGVCQSFGLGKTKFPLVQKVKEVLTKP